MVGYTKYAMNIFYCANTGPFMVTLKSLILCMLFVGLNGTAETLNLKVPLARSALDLSYDYHKQLLRSAIEHGTNGEVSVNFVAEINMHEARASRELIKGKYLDIFWMGTDYNKEQQLRAIKVPTTRGLIGFRKFHIRSQDSSKFDAITTLQQLSQFTACQGTGWPDSVILRNAGIEVAATPSLENIFKMLDAGRCDFFPRGYHDHQKELKLRSSQYPNLISYQGILLHYPFAVYFFTSLENEQLAGWVEQGLEKMIDNGEFMLQMQTHPLTKDVFPLGKETAVRAIALKNGILSPKTDYLNERYWFQAKDFGLK